MSIERLSGRTNRTLRHSSVFFVLLNTLIPVLVGGLVYLSWRTDSLYMFHWLKRTGLDESVLLLRETLSSTKQYLPRFVLYSLPDAAWVYSCSFFMIWLWKDGPKWKLWLWGSIGAVLGIGGELGQSYGIIPGTYDTVDLLLCTLSVVLAISVVNKCGDEECRGTPKTRLFQ